MVLKLQKITMPFIMLLISVIGISCSCKGDDQLVVEEKALTKKVEKYFKKTYLPTVHRNIKGYKNSHLKTLGQGIQLFNSMSKATKDLITWTRQNRISISWGGCKGRVLSGIFIGDFRGRQELAAFADIVNIDETIAAEEGLQQIISFFDIQKALLENLKQQKLVKK